jgi:O-antigen/teichoic acid export membrane protein
MSGDWLKNTAWGLTGEILTRLAKLAQTLVIVRLLGLESFGRFNHALATASLLGVLFDFGVATIALRELSRGRVGAFRLFGRIKLAASLSGLGLLAIGVAVVDRWAESPLLVVALGIHLATADGATYPFVAFRARREFWREALWRALLAGGQFAAAAVVLVAGGGIAGLIATLILTNLISLPALWREWARAGAGAASWPDYGAAIMACLPVAGSVLVGSLYMNWDVVVLGNVGTPAEVAWYSVAVKMVFGLLIMPLNFLQVALLPDLAAAEHGNGPAAWRERWRRSLHLGLAVGGALSVGTALAAEPIVILLFGRGFAPAAPVIAAFVGNCYLFHLYTPLSQYLVIRDRQRAMFGVQAVAALVNVASVPWCVARMGLWGCVVAAGLTHATIALGSLAIVFPDMARNGARGGWAPVARLTAGVALALAGLQSDAGWPVSAGAAAAFLVAAYPEMRAIGTLAVLRLQRRIAPSATS